MSGIESVNDLQSASCPTTLIDVLINIAERSRLTCVSLLSAALGGV
jgi:hypothetical protein